MKAIFAALAAAAGLTLGGGTFAADPKTGAAGSVFNLLETSTLNHRAQVTGGVLKDECGATLRKFFESRR